MPKLSHIPDFSALAKELRKAVPEIADEAVKNEAYYQRRAFKTAIRQQRPFLGLRALSLPYERHKEKAGLHRKVLIRTGHYVQSIGIYKVQNAKYRVGFHKKQVAVDEFGQPVKLTLNKLARILEYGSSKMPPRPHWRRWQRRMRANAPRIRARIQKDINDQLAAKRTFSKYRRKP